MFAVYADHPSPHDPLSALRLGERPDPVIPEGWVRVRMTHASLNRHDLYTLRGVTAHPQGLQYPLILGNDGAGLLDDGTPVALYPMLGSPGWRGDETLAPGWSILGEFAQGVFSRFAAVPGPNAVPLPEGLSPLHASVLGTAWLTAWKALFHASGLRPGGTLLVQGASGGMSTALIQLGRAAGFEVFATSRHAAGRELAGKLGAHRVFAAGEPLPRKVQAVVDSVGAATWEHSLAWVERGGTVVVTGGTSGMGVSLDLLPLIARQITVRGSIMGSLEDFRAMMRFLAANTVLPEIGRVLPLERAGEAFRDMEQGRTHGKTVFTL